MEPFTESIPQSDDQSFAYRWFELPRFPFDWHMHRDWELTWIVAGRGERYVGDHVEPFVPGDLALLGSGLPHTWFSSGGRGQCVSVVIQFPPEFPGRELLELPELSGVRRLLHRASGGLAFRGPSARRVGAAMETMQELSPLDRLTSLIGLLDQLSRCRQMRSLASEAFCADRPEHERQRIDRLYEFIHRHYDRPVSLADAADVVGMNPTAFARFFRRTTGQSFVEHLHHLRVAHACRLLIESDAPITNVCYLSGFGNLSNFNRVFRSRKGCTPRDFRNRYTSSRDDTDISVLRSERAAQPHRCRINTFSASGNK